MVSRQALNKPHYKLLPSAVLVSRRQTIEWMCETGEFAGISAECIHRAAVFFDLILSRNPALEERELQPTALMCLYLSAKLGEPDPEVDKLKFMLRSRTGIRGAQLMHREMEILSVLGWDLQCVTPIDFIQIFAAQGLVFSNDKVITQKGSKAPGQRAAEAVKKYAEFFADLCLQKSSLLQTDSLRLAASIVAVARKQMGLAQVWSKELEEATGVKYEEIEDCTSIIERCYKRMFPRSGRQGKDDKANKENEIDKALSGARTARGPLPSSARMYINVLSRRVLC